jgi:hypothetical protein
VGENFGVSVALEVVAVALEFAPEFVVVLDDPVVNNRHFSGTVRVRVRVRVRGRTVRTPSGVADPDATAA